MSAQGFTKLVEAYPFVYDVLEAHRQAPSPSVAEPVVAKAKLDLVVGEVRKREPALTSEQAFTKALADRPELYAA